MGGGGYRGAEVTDDRGVTGEKAALKRSADNGRIRRQLILLNRKSCLEVVAAGRRRRRKRRSLEGPILY